MDDNIKKALYICGGVLGVSLLARLIFSKKEDEGLEIPRGQTKMKHIKALESANALEPTDDVVPDESSDYVPVDTPIKQAQVKANKDVSPSQKEVKTNKDVAPSKTNKDPAPEISLEEHTEASSSDKQPQPTSTPSAENLTPQVYRVGTEEIKMIVCPTGSFTLDTIPSKNLKDSKYQIPKKNVEIKVPFLLSEKEVTQDLYKSIMGVNPSWFNGKNKYDNIDYGVDLDRPVEWLSWFDALTFCNKLSEKAKLTPCYTILNAVKKDVERDGQTKATAPYIISAQVTWDKTANGFRLPTEDEWQYGALANSKFMFSGSDTITDVAWFQDNSNGKTQVVGSKKPNAWGLYDMSGNVWEMCWDLTQLQKDPVSPNGISKGGAFNSNGIDLILTPSVRTLVGRSNNMGFRLAKNNS